MVKSHAGKRERLKEIARNRELPAEERFQAYLKLASEVIQREREHQAA